MIENVGIIGNGFVGNALYENFRYRTPTRVYDIDSNKSKHTYEQVLAADVVFVCLPTPMMENGECNVKYIWKFFEEVPLHTPCLFVIKSTVPIGTTDQIINFRTDLNILHNPEFLTAENAQRDFFNCDRNVIGGDSYYSNSLKEFLYKVFPEWEEKNVPCYLVQAKESEMIKYFSNSFLAVKIAYFNHVYQTCKFFNGDYDVVRTAIGEDKRIGTSHTKVPGPDGQLGFGGFCFPKDINALIHTLKQCNIDASLLEASWEYNTRVREEFNS
jgi:UDPglucose 6-dehydrogenase